MGGLTEQAGAGGARPWWSRAAMACVVAAGVLLALGRQDWAFVVAALGVVAWFMNVRAGLHRANVERDATRARVEDEDVEDEAEEETGGY